MKAVVEASDASINAHEAQYRALLRIALETAPPVDERPTRLAYRPKRLSEALEPMRKQMTQPSFDRLVAALSLCMGVEAHIALRDVCGLNPRKRLRSSGGPPPS